MIPVSKPTKKPTYNDIIPIALTVVSEVSTLVLKATIVPPIEDIEPIIGWFCNVDIINLKGLSISVSFWCTTRIAIFLP